MKLEDGVEGFYQAVAELLSCESHSYRQFPFRRRTRWNNRTPGNGRFVGHGIVRYFDATRIHVCLINPPVSGVFASPEAALQAISDERTSAKYPERDFPRDTS